MHLKNVAYWVWKSKFSVKKKIGFSINIGLNHYTVAILAQ